MHVLHNMRNPMEIKKVEETSGYTLSNISYVDDSAILSYSFQYDVLNTVVLNQ